MSGEAKDAMMLGVFFLAYGLLSAFASGVRLRLPSRPARSGLDPKLLSFVGTQRARLMREEFSDER